MYQSCAARRQRCTPEHLFCPQQGHPRLQRVPELGCPPKGGRARTCSPWDAREEPSCSWLAGRQPSAPSLTPSTTPPPATPPPGARAGVSPPGQHLTLSLVVRASPEPRSTGGGDVRVPGKQQSQTTSRATMGSPGCLSAVNSAGTAPPWANTLTSCKAKSSL